MNFIHNLFSNIGKKMKTLACISFIIIMISFIILGLSLIILSINYSRGILFGCGLFVIALSPVIAWLSALMLYGFGEIVDTAITLRKHVTPTEKEKTDSNIVIQEHTSHIDDIPQRYGNVDNTNDSNSNIQITNIPPEINLKEEEEDPTLSQFYKI
ncbi:MAG: hypothetical protein E7667_05820 [Ruminococcaceae bacterium]|nr:hypothetical protein [Oscillospiraceae bacterium]